jgi:hypothetical protein
VKRSLITIGTMLGLAICLASYAVWFHYQQGRRCITLWGVGDANLIRHAPRVELIVYPRDLTEGMAESLDISGKPGLVHARHALITDSSYDWSASHPTSTAEFHPTFALVFQDQEKQVVLVFDTLGGRVVELSGIPHLGPDAAPQGRPDMPQAVADSSPQAVLSAAAMQALDTFQERCRSR